MNALRIILGVAGIVFAVAGIVTDNRTIIWVAIGLLVVSFLIRFMIRRQGSGTRE